MKLPLEVLQHRVTTLGYMSNVLESRHCAWVRLADALDRYGETPRFDVAECTLLMKLAVSLSKRQRFYVEMDLRKLHSYMTDLLLLEQKEEQQ